MNKPFIGKKIAILVANGFNEQDLTLTQRSLQSKGANTRIIGMDNGLVNSWTGDAWGHHFASDQVLSTALAADFSMLVVPGGRRSIEKLKLTAHTRRFIGGFMDAGKPVAIFDDALDLLVFAEKVDGVTVAGPESMKDLVEEKGGIFSVSECEISGNLISGYKDNVQDYVDEIIAHFSGDNDMKEAA